jgi:peptide chain release factor 2
MEKTKSKLIKLQKFLEIDHLKAEIERISPEMAKPDFWNNQKKAKKLSEELVRHQETIARFQEVQGEYNELREFIVLGENIEEELDKLKNKIAKLEIESMFRSRYDRGNAILTVHPGAGGTEACDWTLMLFRMYLRWTERKGFKAKLLDEEPGDVAGLKEGTIEVRGKNAYGWLRGETGIHRLVRISPFDASHRRHTSFASCFVYPLIEDEVKIEINDSDLKIDTFRASAPGGQHVNKVSSAIRMTHLSTGIVVTCQAERSQHQNKQVALKVLKSRLYLQKKEEEDKELGKLLPKKHEIGWAREIRSYVFHPYNLVKDHRTGFETHNTEEIMDGGLDDFMKAWLLNKND